MSKLSILLGKTVKKVAKIRGGGSALPGLFMEKISPNFIKKTLSQLPYGVVVVSGTNGKTTTTKMVVELLEAQGLRVFTNKTGSNFVRGVGAALLESVDLSGKLDSDIAVLELDEAHAVHFVKNISPKYSLLLNVMRDQLDRFGEVDYTASLLHKIGESTEKIVVLNRDDPRLGSNDFSKSFSAKIETFGVSAGLLSQFPSDDEIHNSDSKEALSNNVSPSSDDVCLKEVDGQKAKISFSGKEFDIEFKINGVYNLLNAAAAIALVDSIFKEEKLKLDENILVKTLENVQPAFGRGETIYVNNTPVELVLVKNPGGFRLGLSSFSPEKYSTMIAVNDNYSDGRDMSWLWDVEFESLKESGVSVISGVRAYDMALRLFYDEVPFLEDKIETDLSQALIMFLNRDNKPKRIFCTYTAMLKLRDELSKVADVEKVL